MKEVIADLGLNTAIIAGVFMISFVIQLFYYLIVFSRVFRKSPELNKKLRKHPPVSVIICAHNEGENLEKKLPFYLEQDYPEYEVIVVDDRSTDHTADVLDQLKNKYHHLKVSRIENETKLLKGKKLALTLGIKSAKHPYILLSDADCEPAGKLWIRYMMRNYREDTTVVLGVGLYRKKNSLLNLLIRFETAFIAMQYISFTRLSIPYMGVGRNLSYRKEAFFKNKGFASHLKLESGDDDLFVSEISKGKNTEIETHPGSFTYSEPETRWRNWFRQKKRHLTTSGYYQSSIRFLLGLEYLSRMSLAVSFILLLIDFAYPEYLLNSYSFILLVKAVFFKIAFNRFNEKFLFLPSIIMEPFMPWLYGFLHILNYIDRKRSRWN